MTRRYRAERPPSEVWQHLPFIFVADAGVTADDSATVDKASDRMIATVFMRPLPRVLLYR